MCIRNRNIESKVVSPPQLHVHEYTERRNDDLMSSVIVSNFIKAVSNFLTTTNMLKDMRTSSISSVIAIVQK